MIKKIPSKKFVTEEYLDLKLDKRTEEIIEVINEGFASQGQIMTKILDEIAEIKLDARRSQIRLDDHDVRIESLEKPTN